MEKKYSRLQAASERLHSKWCCCYTFECKYLQWKMTTTMEVCSFKLFSSMETKTAINLKALCGAFSADYNGFSLTLNCSLNAFCNQKFKNKFSKSSLTAYKLKLQNPLKCDEFFSSHKWFPHQPPLHHHLKIKTHTHAFYEEKVVDVE